MQCYRLILINSSTNESILKEGLSEYDVAFSSTSSIVVALHLIQDGLGGIILWDVSNITQKEADFIKQLQTYHQKLPIVLLVENDMSSSLDLFASGIFAFLKKPVNCIELLELIQSAIDISKRMDQMKIISATSSWIEVNIPAITSYIPRLSSWISKWTTGFSERDSQRLVFAFRELVQNAIEHGSHFCDTKVVNIRCLFFKKFIMFEIEDEGDGFQFGQIPHAAVGKRKNAAMEVMQYRKRIGMRPGGLGIASVQSIADELIYNQKGNKVSMIRYFSPTTLSPTSQIPPPSSPSK